MKNLVETLLKRSLRRSTVVYKENISESTYHIRLLAEDPSASSFGPGTLVQVFCGRDKDMDWRKKNRFYSVWDFDHHYQTVDIAVTTHSGGPGANWARLCRVGDTVYFRCHKSDFRTDRAGDAYLLIGDTTTLPHYYVINRNLPAGKGIDSLIYSNKENDLYPDINGLTPLNLHRIDGDPTDAIIEKLSTFFLEPKGKRIAYVGGDIRICESVRRYFLPELWENKTQIKLKPFWGSAIRGPR